MGQILQKFNGKEWREKQTRIISNKIFDRVKVESGTVRPTLCFEELYIAMLLVYNDVNKRLPGPHFDPPTREEVRTLLKECDVNLDGELNREEFAKFIIHATKDAFCLVSQGLIVTLAVAPVMAMLTKRTTEGMPVIGKVVQKVPTSAYASLVTLVVMLIQQAQENRSA